jgi:hypothetical protein
MNSLEIAARNFAANTSGLPTELVDMMFATNPGAVEGTYEYIAPMLAGPFGSLVPANDDTGDGYVEALEDVVQLIDGFVMEVPCEHAAVAVHAALQSVKAGIQVLIDDATGVDEDEQLPLPFADLLSALLGGNVKFVSLESSEG